MKELVTQNVIKQREDEISYFIPTEIKDIGLEEQRGKYFVFFKEDAIY